ncbi:MAG: HAD-IB family hydrolase [Planctomycetota bacterium]|nr:HAD-IB family hydrolase [Planctomycetota bacterium]
MSAAFFDVDGTVTRTNIVMYYFRYRRETLRGFSRVAWLAGFSLKCCGFLVVDWISRPAFNRWFYQSYTGIDAEHFRAWAAEAFEKITKPLIFPAAEAKIREHQATGERVVFVTGSIEETVLPLARHLGVEDVIANRLEEKDGRFTGRLLGGAMAGDAKVEAMRSVDSDIDLSRSYAYSDSLSDIAMLEAVGHPVAVNPSPQLRLQAQRAGWPIEKWPTNGQGKS